MISRVEALITDFILTFVNTLKIFYSKIKNVYVQSVQESLCSIGIQKLL